jgi:hypothetical protein
MTYFEADRPARFYLLLDRGADINSTLPENSPLFPGYTLLIFRARVGEFEPAAYTDALALLERGADFNRVAADGTTLIKMLAEHRRSFAESGRAAPPEFEKLTEWLKAHGLPEI